MGGFRGAGARWRKALVALSASLALVVSGFTPAQAAELKLEAPVRISGIWAVGSMIRISDFNVAPNLSAKYSWFIDGEQVGGANDPYLYLSENTSGRRVTAKVDYLDKVTGASAQVMIDEDVKIFSAAPTGGGQMGFGSELIAIPGCFAPRTSSTEKPRIGWPISMTCQVYNTSYGPPAQQSFTWYRNGQPIQGSNTSSHFVQAADASARLHAAFRATWPNGAVMTHIAEVAQKVLPMAPLGAVEIVGTPKPGATLNAKVTGVDSKSALSYTWYADYRVIEGQSGRTLTVSKDWQNKAIHLLVTAKLNGFDASSRLSPAVFVGKRTDLDVRETGYKPIFSTIKPSQTEYDIKYTTSPKVTDEMLFHQQRLLQRAADYWSFEYTPRGVQVLYFTESEGQWADDYIATQPNWSNGTGGTIQNRIKQNGCGFAIAFKANGRQVFLQCLRDQQTELAYDQVGPHEYSHWVQYEIESALFVRMPAWLVEGTANYYGIAIGLAEADGGMQAANTSLAGHATQFDLGTQSQFASFKLLDLFRAGSIDDVTIVFNRSGPVWEQYLVGSLVSEWLVWKYGPQTYFAWLKEVIDTRSGWDKTDFAATNEIFRKHFGFEWADLSRQIAPYLATRADQLQSAWVSSQLLKVGEPKSASAGFTYDFPKFVGTSTEPIGESRGWLHQRLGNTGVRSVQCVGYTSVKPTAVAKRLALARAKSACGLAGQILTEQQRTPIVGVSTATTKVKSLISQVEVTFR